MSPENPRIEKLFQQAAEVVLARHGCREVKRFIQVQRAYPFKQFVLDQLHRRGIFEGLEVALIGTALPLHEDFLFDPVASTFRGLCGGGG